MFECESDIRHQFHSCRLIRWFVNCDREMVGLFRRRSRQNKDNDPVVAVMRSEYLKLGRMRSDPDSCTCE